ncbi:MAG: hypothetical protein LBC27_01335 [Spirochaetaceae bacterium]|jgi:hypothetical protein|nr:hypothetical protein [Spirochaetaceae bacterium]
MKRVCFLPFALLLVVNAAFTQTKGAIFAPFVSGLKAGVNGRQVRLSWTDSESVKGPVYIYRSVQPYQDIQGEITGQIAEVAYGAQTYTDNAPADGKWYYFAVASDPKKQKYQLILPYNNTIDVTVDVSSMKNSENEEYGTVFYDNSGTSPTPEPYQNAYRNTPSLPPYPQFDGIINPPARGSINGITTVASGKGIEIKFYETEPSKNAVLYRSIQPLRSFSDLITATVVALNVRSPYMDYVTPGVPYYYAIVYEDDIRSGRGEIFPGSNATFIPVEVSLNQNQTPPETAAETPPSNTNTSVPNGYYYPPPEVYGSAAYSSPPQNPNASNQPQANRSYPYQTNEALILREPRVFNRDMQASNEADDQRLALIVQGPFMWRDWPAARERLTEFIVETPNGYAADRARFYLAQCWYFIGDIRMALSTFLRLQTTYPEETAIWIQASLNKLAENQ